jgi:drug/metabolite transporter (DMT)-like permease
VWQILLIRSIVIMLGCIAIGGASIVGETIRSPIVRPMFLRSFLILSAWLCYYSAARHLQLAELTTISFAAPLIVTVLSIPLLGERVPASRWAAVIIGFVGVYVACNPTRLGLSLPILQVLAAAFLWGLSIVLMRKIALKERTLVQMMLNNGFFLVVAGVPMLIFWVTPDPAQLALLVFCGVLGGLAQFAMFSGMRYAPASVVAPFEYTALVWAFLLGWWIWNDVPRPELYWGAALIAAAGLMIVVGEKFRRVPA